MSAARPGRTPVGRDGDVATRTEVDRDARDARARLAAEWTVGGLLFALVALVFQQIAGDMSEQGIASGGPYDNAAAYPRALAIALVALVAVRLATLALGFRHGVSPAERGGTRTGAARAAALLALFGLYLAGLDVIGYALASPPFVAVASLLCGERRPLAILGYAVGTTVALSVLFGAVLHVVLPRGGLGIAFPW